MFKLHFLFFKKIKLKFSRFLFQIFLFNYFLFYGFFTCFAFNPIHLGTFLHLITSEQNRIYRWVTGGFGRPAHLGENSEATKKSKFQVKKWKVVFLHKNNSFFGFRPLKWILRSKKTKNSIFGHFRPHATVFQIFLRLT